MGTRPRAASPQGGFAFGSTALDGRIVLGVEAYGTHLHYRFEEGTHLHAHLGTHGKWLRLRPARAPWPQVRLRLACGDLAWDLIAPAVCELLDDEGWERLVASTGPDPLRDDADPGEAWRRIHSCSEPVGAALMDQSVVAGVGTVMRDEILFGAGVHPRRAASSLRRDEFDLLWEVLVHAMRRAVEDGRILTAPMADAERLTIREGDARMVYEQERCRACGGPVEADTIDGRPSYACLFHQPPP